VSGSVVSSFLLAVCKLFMSWAMCGKGVWGRGMPGLNVTYQNGPERAGEGGNLKKAWEGMKCSETMCRLVGPVG